MSKEDDGICDLCRMNVMSTQKMMELEMRALKDRNEALEAENSLLKKLNRKHRETAK